MEIGVYNTTVILRKLSDNRRTWGDVLSGEEKKPNKYPHSILLRPG